MKHGYLITLFLGVLVICIGCESTYVFEGRVFEVADADRSFACVFADEPLPRVGTPVKGAHVIVSLLGDSEDPFDPEYSHFWARATTGPSGEFSFSIVGPLAPKAPCAIKVAKEGYDSIFKRFVYVHHADPCRLLVVLRRAEKPTGKDGVK